MIISFYTPKKSLNKSVEAITDSTAYCFYEDYTEEEGVILYNDCHSFDHLESWYGGELGDDSQGYTFVFEGSKNDKGDSHYYPETVNENNVSDFNEYYMMAYHLMYYIRLKEELHGNSMAYKTLHIWDGGGYHYDGSLEEARKQFDEYVSLLLNVYKYEF